MAQCILHIYSSDGKIKERKTFNNENTIRCYIKENDIKHYNIEINNKL